MRPRKAKNMTKKKHHKDQQHNIKIAFLLVFAVFFANALHGPKVNDTEMLKSKIEANNYP